MSLIFIILVFPFVGMLADFIPQKTTILRWVCSAYVILSVPIFSLLSFKNMGCLLAFLIIQQLFIALFSSSLFPVLIRIFSPEVRYTGIALCYNATWATMATLPMAYTALLNLTSSPWCLPGVLSGIATLSLCATMGVRETREDNAQNTNRRKSASYAEGISP